MAERSFERMLAEVAEPVRGPDVDSRAVMAMLLASGRVRGGSWLNGAPSHVLAEFLTELERVGWQLIQVPVRLFGPAPAGRCEGFTTTDDGGW